MVRRRRLLPNLTISQDSFFSQSGVNVPSRDPSAAMVIAASVPELLQSELDALFQKDWACRRICAFYPQKQRLGGATIESRILDPVDTSRINNWIAKRLLIYEEAQIAANLYGNAAIALLGNDAPTEQPIDIQKLTELEYSAILDKYELTPILDWKGIEAFSISANGNTIKYHPSRVFWFRGNQRTRNQLKNSSGFDQSQLEAFLAPLKRHLLGNSHAAAALADFEQVVLKVPGFAQRLAQNQYGVNEFFSSMKAIASSMGWLVFDADWEAQMLGRTFAGVPEILQNCKSEMVAASGLTLVELYQEFPSGLAATGQSERLESASRYRAQAEKQWGDILNRDIAIYLQLNGIAIDPLDYTICFNSLFEETPLEVAQKLEAVSRVDAANIQAGIYSAAEARTRYAGDVFNMAITLDTNNMTTEQTIDPSVDAVEKVTVNGEVLTSSEYEEIISEEEVSDAFIDS